MTLPQGNGEGVKYEVKELGATELRRGVGRRQSRNNAKGINQSTREVEAPLVRRASVTRIGISIGALLENFIGTGVPAQSRAKKELAIDFESTVKLFLLP